jgi:NAD(P)-dependent dehydrogenase (short-subunit alcohol dehydrogenase family)
MNSTDLFTGRTVIVTGAGSGIGRATALQLLGAGARVLGTDVDAKRLLSLTAEAATSELSTVVGDVTQASTVEAILQESNGQVYGLANVAGIMDALVPAHEVSDELWERVMRVNVTGPMMLTRAVLPLMMAAGAGAIVNVASEAALRGSAAGAAYTTSKHAIVGFTRSVAFMYGPENIRTNAVAPGPVESGITTSIGSEYAAARHLAAGEPGYSAAVEPAVLARSIVWLLSDDAANVNGVVLPSDGGWSVF